MFYIEGMIYYYMQYTNHYFYPLNFLHLYPSNPFLFLLNSLYVFSICFYLLQFLFSLFPLNCSGAHIAWQIKSNPDQSYYAKNLKIVGTFMH